MHLNSFLAVPIITLASAQSYGAAPAPAAPAASSVTYPEPPAIPSAAKSLATSYSGAAVSAPAASISAAINSYKSGAISSYSSSKPASSTAPSAISSATAAAGQTLRVDVGKNGLAFTPNVIAAAPGAKLEYHYFPKNHSLTQSSFQLPCQPLAGGNGVNSGFVPTMQGENPSVFTVTINDTQPVWLYCAQNTGNHCQSGMSMVVNQPAGANNLQAYQAAAKKTNGTLSGIPPKVQGGVFSQQKNGTAPGAPGAPGTSGKPGAPVSSGYPGAPVPSGKSGAPGAPGASNTPRPTPRPTPTGPGGVRYTGAAAKEGVVGGIVVAAAVGVAGLLV